MSRFLAWFVGVTMLIAGTAAAEAWREYTPDGGGYRIDMPGPPTVRTVPVPTAAGTSIPMIEATVRTANAAYAASYVDYPKSITRGASTEALLDNVRDGTSAGQTLRDEKSLMMGRSRGREYVVVKSDGTVAVSRIYWVGGRLYQLLVAGRPGIEIQPGTRRFLESFEIITQ